LLFWFFLCVEGDSPPFARYRVKAGTQRPEVLGPAARLDV